MQLSKNMSLIPLRTAHIYRLYNVWDFLKTCFCAPPAGATRTKDAKELLYARQKVVVTSKAFGLQAIDLVYIDYQDVEGLRLQAREGALMGFTGTLTATLFFSVHLLYCLLAWFSFK